MFQYASEEAANTSVLHWVVTGPPPFQSKETSLWRLLSKRAADSSELVKGEHW